MSFSLVRPFVPLVEGLERGEELDVEEAGHVGAVVGPAELGDDGDDLLVRAVLVGAVTALSLGQPRRMSRMRPT